MISQLSPEFFKRLVDVCADLKCNPLHLLKVMKYESGVSSKSMNKTTKAAGLIQFMPATLKGLNFPGTVDDMVKLSEADQMPWVHKYFLPYKRYGMLSVGRIYLFVFLPGMGIANPSEVSPIAGPQGPNASAYRYNRNFDVDGKGYINTLDLTRAAEKACVGQRWMDIVALLAYHRGLIPSVDNWLEVQKALGVVQDGIPGPKTLAALYKLLDP